MQSLRETVSLDAVLQDIQHLKASKKLLEDVLSYYNLESGEFVFPSVTQWKQQCKRLSQPVEHPRDRLAYAIRNFIFASGEHSQD